MDEVNRSPSNAEEYYSRAIERAKTGNTTGEMQDYNMAIQLNPKYADAYYSRGTLKLQLCDYKGALEDWEKAIELHPAFKEMIQTAIDEARRKMK